MDLHTCPESPSHQSQRQPRHQTPCSAQFQGPAAFCIAYASSPASFRGISLGPKSRNNQTVIYST